MKIDYSGFKINEIILSTKIKVISIQRYLDN